jgi:PAS domain S-box-containing protein
MAIVRNVGSAGTPGGSAPGTQARPPSAVPASEEEGHLRLLLENMPALVWTTDADLRLTAVHGALLAGLGLHAGELVGRQLAETALPGASAVLAYERALHGKRVKYQDSVGDRRFEVNIEPMYEDGSRIVGCMGIALDVTESQDRQDRLLRLSRIHVVLNGINGLIVRVRNRLDLFRESCRVIVNQGGFMLAWVGILEGDAIRPVAYYGDGSVLADLHIGVGAGGASLDPIAVAIREGRQVISNNIASDAGLQPGLRDALLGAGCRSQLVQPLMTGGRAVACLVLNSSEADYFDAEEAKLLDGLAGNISYAMGSITRGSISTTWPTTTRSPVWPTASCFPSGSASSCRLRGASAAASRC